MVFSMFGNSSISHVIRVGGLIACLLIGVMSCDSKPPETAVEQESGAITHDGASSPDTSTQLVEPVVWTKTMRTLPDTVRWALDSNFVHTFDDLRFRLKLDVSQDISRMRFQSERPLISEILMIVSPVPLWRFAQGLKIDSVVYYDPVGKRRLPGQQMISFQRGFDNATVRTKFLPNMAEGRRQSPELQEGQELHPTVYLTWDDRTLIVETQPLLLAFLRDTDPESGTPDLPPDYRSTAPDLGG